MAPASVSTEADSIEEPVEQEEPVEYDESDPLRSTWFKLLEIIKEKHTPALHAFLKEASPVSISDDTLMVEFDIKYKWHREQVQETENKGIIQTELSELMGKPMALKINSPNNDENSEENIPASQIDIQRDAKQDDSVKLVLDVFDGRIVDVKQ